jgi:hypothetical protein
MRSRRIKRGDVEFALSSGPIPIYEQNVGAGLRFLYYGETDTGRLLAVVLTERDGRIRSGERVRRATRVPDCQRGKVYPQRDPGVLVRIQGQAPIAATVHELEKLRCNLCRDVFTAATPEEAGEELRAALYARVSTNDQQTLANADACAAGVRCTTRLDDRIADP